MTWLNVFRTSLVGLAANKLRSGLTTLGIIIGVASVIAMLALGNGARVAVEASFQFLGSDVIQITQKQVFQDGTFSALGQILSFEDGLLMANSLDLVRRVDMSVSGGAKLRSGRNVAEISVSGVTANALENLVFNESLQPVGWPEGQAMTEDAFIGEGRFFTEAEVLEHADVCVLGYKTAENLFEGDYPVGETIWVNRQRCLVVGVLAELESIDPEQRYRSQPNQAFYMPISSAILMLYDEPPSVNITLRVTDEEKMDQAKAQVTAYLRQRHNIQPDAEGKFQDDFEMQTRKDILGARLESAQTFSLLLAAMALVSLVVGGIGIMNVMLVSVTERTREIGIRLAIGARQGDIIRQFLFEAILLSVGGGLLGVAVGLWAIPLAASLNQGIAVLDPESIPLALGLALLTGILFGLYPAIRAARLDPVDALRYE